ncbi:MAG: right-handed parallel beta-helix repeat-containing protein [Gammaproteobacteria bacterium]|nr:right-handed parallel beta-helix repeat-containing protein [Gammaproteobacteria bacterium]
MKHSSLFAALIAVISFGTAIPANAATLTVTTTTDAVDPSDGVLSLREAVADAADGDVVVFDRSLLPGVVQLTLGDLILTRKNLTIEGYGADQITIDGRILLDNSPAGVPGRITIALRSLTLSGGGLLATPVFNLEISDCIVENSNTHGIESIGSSPETATIVGTTIRNNLGAGIRNDFLGKDVTIINSVIENNALDGVSLGGDGIDTTLIIGSTVRNNGGDGIFSRRGGTLTVVDSNIHNNDDSGVNLGTLTSGRIVNSFISYNGETGIVGAGGGVFVEIVNSIMQGNSAQVGGGLFGGVAADFVVRGSQILGNSADDEGGGIYLSGGGATASLFGSRVSGNQAGNQGGGAFVAATISELTVSSDSTIQSNTPDNCAPEPLCPPLPSEPTLVDFDDPKPLGSSFSFLNGVFEGINFGANQWRWEGAYNVNPTNHIFFASGAGQSRSFSFDGGPRILRGMQVFSPRAGTLTLTDDAGQTYSKPITTGSLIEIETGWTLPAMTVTVQFTRGWDLGVDNIVYE